MFKYNSSIVRPIYFNLKQRNAISNLQYRCNATWSTAKTHLFTWGSGCNGELGTGDTKYVLEPTEVQFFKDINIKTASAGWGHSAVVSTDGTPYIFGRTHDLRNCLRVSRLNENWPTVSRIFSLIGGNASIDFPQPTELYVPGIVKNCICSAALTAFLTEEGEVYTLGTNRYGQCGIGTKQDNIWEPTLVQGLEDVKIRKVVLGFQHAIAMCENGQVYSWGKGTWGQLACEQDVRDVNAAQLIKFFQDRQLKVVDIGAGFNHSVFLTDDGNVWICGKYQSTELDEKNDKNFAHAFSPRLVEFDHVLHRNVEVTKVACGQQHSVALASDGSVWQWGMQPDFMPNREDTEEHFKIRHSKDRMVHVPQSVGGMFRLDPSTEFFTGHDITCVIQDGLVLEWDWDLTPTHMEEIDPEVTDSIVSIHLGWKHKLG